MSNQDLPVKSGEDFLAETEVMDLSPLKDQLFLVAVSTGERSKGRFLTNTPHGPYSFVEMCEEVGTMYQEHQHHAKVVVLEKARTKAVKHLDENTVDYIECHYMDIIAEAMLDGVFDDKEFTCQAGIVENEENPLAPKEEDKLSASVGSDPV